MSQSDDQARAHAEPQPITPHPPATRADPQEPAGPTGLRERAALPREGRLPPYRLILHNDPVHDALYVVETLCDLTPLMPQRAAAVMVEAHRTGLALVLTTHRERAELYVEQFRSRSLTVTMEAAD
ncbi:MAG: ATP-dependent Clp protease adaptor ClpS [Phycisphaerales bacterium]